MNGSIDFKERNFIDFKESVSKSFIKGYFYVHLCLERGNGHIGVDLASNPHNTKFKP